MAMLAMKDGCSGGGGEMAQGRKIEWDVVVVQDNFERMLEFKDSRFLHALCQAPNMVVVDCALSWIWMKLS